MSPSKNTAFPFLVKDQTSLLTSADSLPTVAILRNAVTTSVAATVESISTGSYKASFTVPSNWEDGDRVDAKITATINGYTDSALVRIGEVSIGASGPTAADIKTALEASGSKLDKALKAAQAAEDQTL